jgi:septum formation protein
VAGVRPAALTPVTVRLVLASASSGRRAVLRGAGVEPDVVVSGVDESGVTGAPDDVALELARRKASAVAALPGSAGAVVLGCDSVLDLDGDALGKPADAGDARRRWVAMRGRRGVLVTGHCLVDVRTGQPSHAVAAVDRTPVRFADVTDAEVDAYVATGEPERVAGAFTVDGLGGWFVASLTGAPSNVIGLSLPLLRTLLAELGMSPVDIVPAFANR